MMTDSAVMEGGWSRRGHGDLLGTQGLWPGRPGKGGTTKARLLALPCSASLDGARQTGWQGGSLVTLCQTVTWSFGHRCLDPSGTIWPLMSQGR